MLLLDTTRLKDKEIFKQRVTSCNNCEHYSKLKICKRCGCFMPVKRKLLYAICPENLWPNMPQTNSSNE
jgi:hypothetical protein